MEQYKNRIVGQQNIRVRVNTAMGNSVNGVIRAYWYSVSILISLVSGSNLQRWSSEQVGNLADEFVFFRWPKVYS